MQDIVRFFNELDIDILRGIQEIFQSDFMDRAMPFITSLGDSGMIWIAISLILIITKRYRKAGIVALMALLVTTFLGEVVIKNIIQRARPFVNNEGIKLLIPEPSSFSFPSGHTGSSFAAASALAANIKGYGKYFLILAALIAFSRLYLMVHYPSDIVGGILLGVLSAKIAQLIYNRITDSKNEKTTL
ncbi:phosphatase PAP2 family protein [Alloiococcus sp. CFN-8]|uniref:phosphatase PAP2 family protein n=1 Tax=Alloiococcus sp. CFN-8 TaxID=3416081 RepID=UPI003CEFB706